MGVVDTTDMDERKGDMEGKTVMKFNRAELEVLRDGVHTLTRTRAGDPNVMRAWVRVDDRLSDLSPSGTATLVLSDIELTTHLDGVKAIQAIHPADPVVTYLFVRLDRRVRLGGVL